MENVHEVASGPEIEIIQITEINFGAYSAATPPHGEALLSFDVCQFGSEIAFLHRVHWDGLECWLREVDFCN